MGITQFIYNYIFIYFCLPAFILMLFGKPRFLIKAVKKIFQIELPRIRYSFGTLLVVFCLVWVAVSYYKKTALDGLLSGLKLSAENEVFYSEKTREAHLHQRNGFMYFTFFIMIIILKKLCNSYEKLWKSEDELAAITKIYH
jgi:hypothetical protein